MIELLHFLRPLWLLALPAVAVLWWLTRRHEAGETHRGTFVAGHLALALTINREAGSGLRAVDGVALAMVSLAIAAAGPSWSKQTSPWFEETAPLVVALEVTDSMRSNDMLPSRLDRARFKVLDLIGSRTGARTALIAYAGSAHIVSPPSTDVEVIKLFLESLDPAIMPTSGTNAAAVLPLTRQLLGDDAAIATLLFVNDGFEGPDIAALAEFAAAPDSPAVAALVVGTESGGVALRPDGSPVLAAAGGALDTSIDVGVLNRAAREADVSIVRAGAGDGDIRALSRAIESNLRRTDDPNAQWRDEAWRLLWPAAILALLWFRRGWTMRW
jgi:Ca-activated chloride channel family protein